MAARLADRQEDALTAFKMDPANQAQLDAAVAFYEAKREAANDPETKFHYAMMARVQFAIGMAFWEYGIGLAPTQVMPALFDTAAKIVAQGASNMPPYAQPDYQKLGRALAEAIEAHVIAGATGGGENRIEMGRA